MNADLDQSTLEHALADLPIPAVRWQAVTGSTNDDALAWAAAGAPDGALVAANQQTNGRGRLARQWVTQPGAALAFSLVLHPQAIDASLLPQYALLGGLAVCLSLEALGAAGQAAIKWPNDVLLNGRKVCGVLAEARWQGEAPQVVVLGIGVNVAPGSVPPPESVRFPAGSVSEELGFPVDRLALLGDILRHLFAWRDRLGKPDFLAAWETRLAFRGGCIRVSLPDGKHLSGLLEGVDPQGALHLRKANGDLVEVLAGDVSLRPATPPSN
ncbi:MAG: biotin--[acetyl-CoA-carboxylase] ligase [Anaerolineae bacterium]|nr:biotin--[acetyl-CoA-carboxylase] ligase [Anaerolineae bacterium]